MSIKLINNGQEDWLNTLNANSALINKLPVDGAIHVNSPATFLSGASGYSNCWYLPFNGGKLVVLSLWQIATTTSIVRHDLFSLPDALAPSYAVGAILNEVSYITNRHASQNAFTFWSSNTTDNLMDMDTTLVYLHFD
ncbi:hypothetical protein H0G69_06375 [Limosilactobacillus mucosae]|uniref:hypothetical protein n=1 Tax=Limosilactobacillus mucosae TaxID=97478 RepID=UPI0015D5460B|nr:hypothetical protein [Limosilactobacillus mucosae]QLI94574.1 hypothetical protein H0G69_06375 [Limosilactobacillus mucosae]